MLCEKMTFNIKIIIFFSSLLLCFTNSYAELGQFGGKRIPPITNKETRTFWEKRIKNDGIIIANQNKMIENERKTQDLLEKLIEEISSTDEEELEASKKLNDEKFLQLVKVLVAQLEEQRKLNKIFESSR